MLNIESGWFLSVDVFNTTAVTVTVDVTVKKTDGTMHYDSYEVIPNTTNGSKYTQPTPRALPAGVLMGATARTSTSGVQRGQVFVSGQVRSSNGTNYYNVYNLFSGYITSNSYAGYPGTGLQDSLTGSGYVLDITGSGPGDEPLVLSLPVNCLLLVRAITVGLTTDSTVGDRRVSATLITPGGLETEIASNIVQAASLTYRYCYSRPYYQNPTAPLGVNKVISLPCPENKLYSTGQISITVAGGENGDALSAFVNLEQLIIA